VAQDEADILGDRIAIMADGRLQCVGSSLFLKAAYGVGYTLTVIRLQREAHAAAAADKHDDGVSVSVCFTGQRSPVVAVGDALDEAVRALLPEAEGLSAVGAERSYKLPLSAASHFGELFTRLESPAEKARLGVAEFGISVTTLEEVFMRVGRMHATAPGGPSAGKLHALPASAGGSGVAATAGESSAGLIGAAAEGDKLRIFGQHFAALFIKVRPAHCLYVCLSVCLSVDKYVTV
jgi:hypothetical protein